LPEGFYERNFRKIHRKSRKYGCQKYKSGAICPVRNKLNNNIFLFIVRLLLVMIGYNFRPVYYIWSKPYNLVKMVFLTLIFRPLSREPTFAHHKRRVNKIFVIITLPLVEWSAIHRRLFAYTCKYTARIITKVSNADRSSYNIM